jgi:hypothetical protein
MPIVHAQFTLDETTPTRIVENHNMPHDVILHNMSKSSNQFVFIGSGNVSKTNAMHIDPGGTIYLTLPARDDLWAVSDPSGIVVGVTDIRKGP